ncbi:MAG: hypothetical protein V4820_03215 [Pseudomonadota bacterium]
MKSREFRDRLLVALVQTARANNLGSFLDPAEIADAFRLPRQTGQLRLVVNDLDAHGLVRPSYTLGGGEDGGLDLRLTSVAIEEAEDLLEEHPEYRLPYDAQPVPAADRYVSLSDNLRSEVREHLQDARSAIRATNDAEDEEREIALSEIAAFEATVTQPRVSTELIERFVSRVLAWLVKAFGEAMVGVVASALIAKLMPLTV